MLQEIKKADLNAPRYRPNRLSVLDRRFYSEFKKKYPEYKSLPNTEITKIIYAFNELIAENIITNRDGVELPEGLGYCFIGTCRPAKKQNTDFYTSKIYNKRIKHRNFESDNYLAKIFYSNYANKYKFVNRECWGFNSCRNFSRAVAKVYPEQWPMYITIDPYKKIRKIYQGSIMKDLKERINQKGLEDYNELEI